MCKKREVKIGEVFNRWTVIGYAPNITSSSGKTSSRALKCRCECGTERVMRLGDVVSGHSKSCGCYKSETTSRLMKKYNTYEINGEVTKVFDDRGNFALIDTEDLQKVKPFYFWKSSTSRGGSCGGYWATSINYVNTKVLMHRILTDAKEGELVDHINHNRDDNRRSNLVICDPKDNMRNYPVIGIVFVEHANKWQISIGNKDNIQHIGTFDTFDEAVEAYRPYIDGGNFNESYR